jgi:hypothetical protein
LRVKLRAIALGLGFAVLATGTVLTQDSALGQRARFSAEADQLYLPRASALSAMSLGHHELAADLVFVRAIIYFGGQLSARSDFRWLENYLDTIVELDPSWRTPYKWAGVATMYNGREITNQSVMLSSHFLALGVKQFPSDWELPFMLGCNYLFELHGTAEEEAGWRRIGVEYIRHAALVGGGPSWLPLLAATILKREGDEQAAIKHLEEVYLSTTDAKTQAEVKNRLIALHAQIDFQQAEKEKRAFEAAWRTTAPYVSPDFFVLLGAAPEPRLDLPYLARNELLELPSGGE